MERLWDEVGVKLLSVVKGNIVVCYDLCMCKFFYLRNTHNVESILGHHRWSAGVSLYRDFYGVYLMYDSLFRFRISLPLDLIILCAFECHCFPGFGLLATY